MKKDMDVAELKRQRGDSLAATERDLASGIDGRELCQRTLDRASSILRMAWKEACQTVASADAELVAVGSFGRGTLGPFSDLDVRIVVARDGDALADALLYPLWDSGFGIGHQVLSAGDWCALAQTDLATATSLLDARHLAGVHNLKNVSAKLPRLLAQLREDSESRQHRFGGSVYLLEPEVKLGTGGLRDIDAIHWAVRSSGRVLSDHDATRLSAAEEFLLRVRNRLHVFSRRRNDRLSFDAQEALATAMGYPGETAEAAEQLMQDYYRAARDVSSLRERVLSPELKRSRNVNLGRGLLLVSNHVALEEGGLESDPASALRLYADHARTNRPVWHESKDAIARACAQNKFCSALRASSEAAHTFVDLVCTTNVLSELHDVGLLVAMIPEFLPVTGRVHHDTYHVLTVDAHSVAAVDWLSAMFRGEHESAHPIATRICDEIRDRVPLFLATLLHDYGKGHPDRKNHSLYGAELCDVVLPRLGIDSARAARIRALVLNHLAMYHVAARRDLDEPATIAEFTKVVGDREGLRDLFLLTIADIATTSPTAMTSWKARMLEHLFLRADAHLAGAPADTDLAERVISAAREDERSMVECLVADMPERYLAAHPPDAIVRHARIVSNRRGPCAVELVPSRHENTLELVVVAFDAPGLLAKIAAALTANRLEVLAAHVHSVERKGSMGALDVFFVRPLREAPAEDLVVRTRRDLTRLLTGEVEPAVLLSEQRSPWRERESPAVPTRVAVDNQTSPAHTIVEVTGKDRPGLLFALAQALHELGLTIAFAKVSTEGAKAIDVFYVHGEDGKKVESKERLASIRDSLQSAVTGKGQP